VDPSGLVQAIQDRAWYSVVAFAVVLAIAACKRLGPGAWEWVPARWQWAPAVVLAGATAFVGAWQTGATWQEALSVAVYVAITGGGAAIGMHHSGKRVVAPRTPPVAPSGDGDLGTADTDPGPGDGGTAARFVALGVGCALASSLAACGGATSAPCSPDWIKAGKRAAGCAVISAGECDTHPLSDCPALDAAQNAHAAQIMTCASLNRGAP
jgi:hypothetical protein